MQKYNFHTHTKRCGHAIGEDEEYVKEAVSCGFSTLYFSDHVSFPYFDQKGTRGSYSEDMPDYLKSIEALKNKYKDKLDIDIGFEAEYSPYFVDYYKFLLSSNAVKYLILGQHFHFPTPLNLESYSRYGDEGIKKYVDDVIEGIKTGLFLYVCHPDIFVYFYNKRDEYYKNEARRLIKTAVEYDIPLEINVSKMENRRLAGYEDFESSASFPEQTFWEIAKEEQPKVVIGLDAHTPQNVNDFGFNLGLKVAKKYKLQVLNEGDIKKRIDIIRKKFC